MSAVAPILDAYEIKPGIWVVWCDHCQSLHHHGALEGHRVAHCVDGPYLDLGYVLRFVPGPVPKRKRRAA